MLQTLVVWHQTLPPAAWVSFYRLCRQCRRCSHLRQLVPLQKQVIQEIPPDYLAPPTEVFQVDKLQE